MQQKVSILFLNGIPDDRKVEVYSIQENGSMITSLMTNSSIPNFVHDANIFPRMTNLDIDPKQEIGIKEGIHIIFNQISDADLQHIVLTKADIIYQKFSKLLPFYNIPSKVMNSTKDTLSKTLKDIPKVHIPDTIKINPISPEEVHQSIEKEKWNFPVIFMPAGQHRPSKTLLIKNKSEQFHIFALDGRRYYLTPFVEYGSKEGIYTKYRLLVIDGEVFLRYAISGDQQILHFTNRFKDKKAESLAREISKSFIGKIKPAIQPAIDKIHQRIGLDYFGIDCHIDNEMNLLIFDIGAHIAVQNDFSHPVFKALNDDAHKALVTMLTQPKNKVNN